MIIEIHSPEAEVIIRRRMSAGGFQSAEEAIVDALKSATAAEAPSAHTPRRPAGRKSLAQLFADSPFKGFEIDFERDPDCGRDVTL